MYTCRSFRVYLYICIFFTRYPAFRLKYDFNIKRKYTPKELHNSHKSYVGSLHCYNFFCLFECLILFMLST